MNTMDDINASPSTVSLLTSTNRTSPLHQHTSTTLARAPLMALLTCSGDVLDSDSAPTVCMQSPGPTARSEDNEASTM